MSSIQFCKGGRALRIAVGITMLVLVLAGGVGAAMITVNASGGGDYTRIQDAINESSNGDIIWVAAGTYNENVIINKSVSLHGESNSTTIINGNGSGNIFEVIANGVVINGFMIQNGSNGIHITSSNNVFSNNVIRDMEGVNGGSGSTGGSSSGIYVSGSNNNSIINNIINNFTGGLGGTAVSTTRYGSTGGISSGIYLFSSINTTLTGNTISNMRGGGGGTGGLYSSGGTGGISSGIYLSGSINNTLIGNNISNMTGGMGGTGGSYGSGGTGGISSGIYLYGSANNSLTGNIISNSTGGVGGKGCYGGSGGTGGISSGGTGR